MADFLGCVDFRIADKIGNDEGAVREGSECFRGVVLRPPELTDPGQTAVRSVAGDEPVAISGRREHGLPRLAGAEGRRLEE